MDGEWERGAVVAIRGVCASLDPKAQVQEALELPPHDSGFGFRDWLSLASL